MTNQEILTKAIEKAIAGGWAFELSVYMRDDTPMLRHMTGDEMFNFIRALEYPGYLRALIFNHEFAKALWGEEYKHYPLSIYRYTYSGTRRNMDCSMDVSSSTNGHSRQHYCLSR